MAQEAEPANEESKADKMSLNRDSRKNVYYFVTTYNSYKSTCFNKVIEITIIVVNENKTELNKDLIEINH